MNMMPGMSQYKGMVSDEEADDQIKKTKAIIQSMTKEERANPSIFNPSRKMRVAKGAGVDISEVNRLIKQVESQKKMMKQLSSAMGGKKGMMGMPKFPFKF